MDQVISIMWVQRALHIPVILTLVFAVMACSPEEPELVATAAPTDTPTTMPVPTVAPEPTATVRVPTPEPTATPQRQAFDVGDTVRLGSLHITVNGVRASLGDNFWAPEEGNYFIYVDVTFRNEGNQPEVVSTLIQMEMRDAEGRLYNTDLFATASNSSSLDGEIAPGGNLRGEVGYQLPASEVELTWRFSGDLFRLGQAVFSLGTVAVPVPPQGSTLDDPLPAGEVLLGSDGTEVRVVGIAEDAWRQIAEENSFNDPPGQGMRFYIVRLEIANPSGASGSVKVSGSDFSLIGDNRVVYGGLLNSISCGLIPDALGGKYGAGSEIFAGGRVEGNICLEIPEDEGGFILIHEPGYGADSRRFLRLPYGEAKEPTPTPEATAAPTTTPTPTAIPKPESTPTPASTATPTPEPTPVAIGTTVEAGGSSYTLNEVKDPAPAGIFGVNEGKRLIALDITQVGISGGGDSYNPFYFAIQDTDGYVYTPGFSDADVGPPFGSGKLSADQIVRGWVVFELPESARLVSVLVNPEVFGARITIADLAQE